MCRKFSYTLNIQCVESYPTHSQKFSNTFVGTHLQENFCRKISYTLQQIFLLHVHFKVQGSFLHSSVGNFPTKFVCMGLQINFRSHINRVGNPLYTFCRTSFLHSSIIFKSTTFLWDACFLHIFLFFKIWFTFYHLYPFTLVNCQDWHALLQDTCILHMQETCPTLQMCGPNLSKSDPLNFDQWGSLLFLFLISFGTCFLLFIPRESRSEEVS